MKKTYINCKLTALKYLILGKQGYFKVLVNIDNKQNLVFI